MTLACDDFIIMVIYMVYTLYIHCISRLSVKHVLCVELSCSPVMPSYVRPFKVLQTSIASL